MTTITQSTWEKSQTATNSFLPSRSFRAFVDSLLLGLGKHKFADIKVAPFSVDKFGQKFGLIFDLRNRRARKLHGIQSPMGWRL